MQAGVAPEAFRAGRQGVERTDIALVRDQIALLRATRLAERKTPHAGVGFPSAVVRAADVEVRIAIPRAARVCQWRRQEPRK